LYVYITNSTPSVSTVLWELLPDISVILNLGLRRHLVRLGFLIPNFLLSIRYMEFFDFCDGFGKFGGAPIIEIGGRVGVGASLLDQIANEVLGVFAERAVGLGAEGVKRVAGPGLEPLRVGVNLAVLDDVCACSTLTGP
jgi:hypothetical protein